MNSTKLSFTTNCQSQQLYFDNKTKIDILTLSVQCVPSEKCANLQLTLYGVELKLGS